MKKRFIALCCLLTATAVYAEPDSEPEPPTNLFFDTDVYIYLPKFTLTYGMRGLSGAKSSFHGFGHVTDEAQHIADTTGTGETRIYHDGDVGVDQRTVSIDDGNGGVVSLLITPDGSTNTWGFADAKQIVGDGTIAMHAYTADVVDSGPRSKNPGLSFGNEVVLARDIGKIAGRFDWSISAGLSINDLASKMTSFEKANITTITDTYSLNGAPAPTPPYSAPSSSSVPLTDSSGNTLLNADGTAQTVQVDSSVLLGNTPETRTQTTTTDTVSVMNHYHLHGAYYTFRVGPTLVFPVTTNFRATLSLGGALVYAGTTYSVEQEFKPDTGNEIFSDVSDTQSHFLPGYYADASMEYWMSNRTAFYLGAVYQSTGSFTQTIVQNTSPGLDDTATYSTRVDLSSMQGFRFGVNYRF
ncbi:MAG TPA: hypothetical protein VG838_07670 [Opitutaceae bacterium]|nr:hypothetical protein [Opitutaceae bacterium]